MYADLLNLFAFINDNNYLPELKYAYSSHNLVLNPLSNQTKITFQPNGAPYSSEFDDIYFDTDSGYQQSEEVFIRGNNLTERLVTISKSNQHVENPQSTLTIAETGFGTGLNFLLTFKTYLETVRSQSDANFPKVHFISTEKYPMTLAQLEQSLAVLPNLASYSKQLINQYPEQLKENAIFEFLDGRITLTLLVGDSTECFREISTTKGLVDAWYLDGFSPSRNPDMWQLALYQEMARLSKPQATLSTFTVAGKVRRELTQAGFRLVKRNLDCKKQEILVGTFQQSRLQRHGYKIRPVISKPQQVTMIGGGIAAACTAYALTKNGVKVTLYCKDTQVAQGASSNAIGALFPLLHQQQDEISLFYQQAFTHARQVYDRLLNEGFHFEHDWCGLLEVSYKETLIKRQQQFEQLNAWPKDLIHSVNAEQVSNLASISLDMGGLFMPKAGWISPPSLVNALFTAAKATGRLRIKHNIKVTGLAQKPDDSWQLITDTGPINADILIYCGGADSIDLDVINQLPLSPVRGQISEIRSNNDIKKLSTVVCHKGYLTPANHGKHCIGATFTKNSTDIVASRSDDEFNVNMLHRCLPNLTHLSQSDIAKSNARLRCMTPDHLPLVGPMPNIDEHVSTYPHLYKDKNWKYNEPAPTRANLYVLTGLGARGLVSAPLLADILTADICGTPYPVDDEQLFNLSPNRFVIRDLIKRKITPA